MVFTKVLQWSLSSAKPLQPIPHHPILILSTHLRLGLPFKESILALSTYRDLGSEEPSVALVIKETADLY
jgi:hypothetical protein